MKNVFMIDHPLVQHHLMILRDKATPSKLFREGVQRLTTLIAYEATKDLKTEVAAVETPLAQTSGLKLNERVAIVPILRAGLGMVEPVLNLIPTAEVWHLGFYRDEKTFEPVEYYQKLPPGNPTDVALIVDPMLATGGSCIAALQAMDNWGVKRKKLLAVIAAPEGIEKVHSVFPDTQIYVCSLDEKLNDRAYILPGLGDAGDRIFNAAAH